MIKKHYKEILVWIFLPVFVVLFLLLIVYGFEKMDIHAPGSREMWMGLIGAALGGWFTMAGVLVTIYKQEEENKEDKRLEFMPVLKFCIIDMHNMDEEEPMFDATLSCLNGELFTSGFEFIEQKKCKMIEISILNNVCVFDFTIEGCLINGKEMKKGIFFNPDLRRLVEDEKYRLIFDNGDYTNTNEFCLIRFSYKDIFGHQYYQDLPLVYFEVNSNTEHCLEIRDVKAPILVSGNERSLEQVAKEYCDYGILF